MKKIKLLILSLFMSQIPQSCSFAQSPDESVCVRIGNIIVSGRNMGTPTEGSALNYTNDKDHPDHKNSAFKGGLYTKEQAQTICYKGWRLPTGDEMKTISNAMQFSEGRVYLEDDDGNRCYFPLSSSRGHYWTSATGGGPSVFTYTAHGRILLRVTKEFFSGSFSVRCVKTAP